MIGLVLEGGGAKGSYHVGAYKAILDEGIEIQGVTGTSAGALNGAMIVQGDFDICCKLWEDISYSMVINANDEEMQRLQQLKLNKNDLRILADKLKLVISDRGFDITPFKNLLDLHIDEDKIRKSNMDFGMVTVNLTDFKPIEVFKEDIPYGKLKDYLLASAYLPAFKTEKLGGKVYLDGAFYDNLPFSMLQRKGYKDLILVRTHARGITRKINMEELNAIIISPSEDIGKSYTYEADIARRNIELGYYDGLRALRRLKGKKYYIESVKDKDYYLNFLLSIEEDKIRQIKDLMHISFMPNRRALFEYIIPKIGSALGLNKDFTYEDFLIGILERRAEELGIYRFKIYPFEEILGLVKCGEPVIVEKSGEELSPLEKIIEKVDFATIFNKDEIILQVADIIFCK